MHFLKECVLEIIVLIDIWNFNWILLLNNNKDTLIYLFMFEGYNFWGKWVYIRNKTGISCYLWNGTTYYSMI